MQSFSFDACISGLDNADVDADIGVIFLLNISSCLNRNIKIFAFFKVQENAGFNDRYGLSRFWRLSEVSISSLHIVLKTSCA